MARFEDRWAEDGFGVAVAERKGDGAFVGMVGLSQVRFAPTAGDDRDRLAAGAGVLGTGICHRGGARLAGAWLRGAGAGGDHRFHRAGECGLAAVMLRLGMRRDPARDFAHPALPAGHELSRHLVFVLKQEEWRA